MPNRDGSHFDQPNTPRTRSISTSSAPIEGFCMPIPRFKTLIKRLLLASIVAMGFSQPLLAQATFVPGPVYSAGPPITGYNEHTISGINNSGVVVGSATRQYNATGFNEGQRGYVFSSSGTTVLQPITFSSTNVGADRVYAINNSGLAVGFWANYSGGTSATSGSPIVWNTGTGEVTVLDTTAAATSNASTFLNVARLINDAGEIVGNIGQTGSTTNPVRTVRWDAATG
jgi:hypothetical protein